MKVNHNFIVSENSSHAADKDGGHQTATSAICLVIPYLLCTHMTGTIFEGFPWVTALLSQMPLECTIYGPSTLQYTGELCYGIEQITLSLAQY